MDGSAFGLFPNAPYPTFCHMNRSRHSSFGAAMGFYLWRGGLLFSAAYLSVEGLERAWRFLLMIGVPAQVAAGVGFVLVGLILLFGSLIVERMIDARAEKGLKDL